MVVKLYRYRLSECLAGAMRKKAGTAETGSDKSDKSDGSDTSDGLRFSIGDGNKQNNADENKKNSTLARSSTGLSQSFPDYRGLGSNLKKVTTAALQSVEYDHNIASASKKSIGILKKQKNTV